MQKEKVDSHERLLYTIDDVAHILSLGRTKVYALISDGAFRSVKIGKSNRVRRSDLEAWVASL